MGQEQELIITEEVRKGLETQIEMLSKVDRGEKKPYNKALSLIHNYEGKPIAEFMMDLFFELEETAKKEAYQEGYMFGIAKFREEMMQQSEELEGDSENPYDL